LSLATDSMTKAIELTKRGPKITSDQAVIEALRAEFASRSFIYLRQLIAPEILDLFCSNVEKGGFQRMEHPAGAELDTTDLKTSAMIEVLFNNTRLFEFIRRITDCGSIGSFSGRVYRYLPDEDHYDRWHNDLVQHRLVALSINLNKQPYEGGLLELKDKDRQIVESIPNTVFGDGILFRLADHLEHRRTTVRGNVPKTAIAGWFRSEPRFMDLIRQFQST